MKITIESSVGMSKVSTDNESLDLLKSVFKNTVLKHGEQNDMTVEWVSDSEVVLDRLPAIPLHTFVLMAEKMGKKVSYQKYTTIHIID